MSPIEQPDWSRRPVRNPPLQFQRAWLGASMQERGVSAVVTTWNNAGSISQCLGSILAAGVDEVVLRANLGTDPYSKNGGLSPN